MKLKIEELEFNRFIINSAKNPFIISSGLSEVWNDVIGKSLGLKTYAGKNISAETKLFVTKFLKQRYKITAYGDSKNDLFMLKEADKGILVINNYLSRSLKKDEIRGLEIMNFARIFHIVDDDELIVGEDKERLSSLIEITKSNSRISGNRLAKVHLELGKELCRYLSSFTENDTTIISLERSGHFLADGVYMGFDCRFETYNSNLQSLPEIKTKNVVLVDGVINSGKSMLKTIHEIEECYPNTKISVVAGVVNVEALSLFALYNFIAVRISKNKFIGSNVQIQNGDIGPDTAERLFNQLN